MSLRYLMRPRPSVVILRFFLSAALMAQAAVGAAHGVIVRGRAEYILEPNAGRPGFESTCGFEASVAGCGWVIRYQPWSVSSRDRVDREVVGSCDGTNIYVVHFVAEAAARKAFGDRYEAMKDQLPVANAEIFPGAYPPPEAWDLQKLWLGLASSCVFRRPRGQVKPVSGVDLAVFYDDARFRCDYHWTTNAADPAERFLVLWNQGGHPTRDSRDWRLTFAKYPPPYNHGFTNGIARWTGGRVVAGTFVARSFDFTEFAPQPGGNSPGALRPAYLYRCVVTNITEGEIGPIPPPPPPGSVFVWDRRFEKQGVPRLDYAIRKGAWLSSEEPGLLARVRATPKSSFDDEYLKRHGVRSRHSDFERHLIWVCLVLPLGLVAGRALFGKSNQSTER